ncbi:MAG: acyl-CoA dehydrogenase family protein [bacterium]|nr:acyl-CoA dehydrogenase family protein [bacterium]
MSIPFTAEQAELQDTLRKFFEESVPSSYLRKRYGDSSVSDPKLWGSLIELGLLLSFAKEEHGGVAMGFRELGILAFEAGRSLLPEPILDTAFFGSFSCSKLLDETEILKLPDGFLDSVTKGSRKVSFAPSEVASNSANIEIKFALNCEFDSWFFIKDASKKDSLLLFDLSKCQKKITNIDLVDQTTKCSNITIEKTVAHTLSIPSWQNFWAMYLTLRAQEIAGVCEKALLMTVDHVKTRKQFDTPIGSFQAVQHKLSDMYLSLSAMKALANFASWAGDNSKESISLSGLSAAHFALERAPSIIESAIQLHGGTGFTWEYDLHLYLRRIKMWDALLGSNPSWPDDILNLIRNC